MGQRIRALGERDDASPTEAIRNLQESRVKEAQAKLPKGETVESAKGRIAREIKAAITKATPKKEDWASFVQSLQC